MKVNKKVSDLARKLDYIRIESKEDKRRIIKKCLNPFSEGFFLENLFLERYINKNYKNFKKYLDKLSEKYPNSHPEIRYTFCPD